MTAYYDCCGYELDDSDDEGCDSSFYLFVFG